MTVRKSEMTAEGRLVRVSYCGSIYHLTERSSRGRISLPGVGHRASCRFLSLFHGIIFASVYDH